MALSRATGSARASGASALPTRGMITHDSGDARGPAVGRQRAEGRVVERPVVRLQLRLEPFLVDQLALGVDP